MTDVAGIDATRTARARTRAPGAAQSLAGATGRDRDVSRVVLGTAIAAVAILVLLMPATPLVAFVLISAVSLGVAAALVRRAEDRRSTGESLDRLTARGYLVLADRRSPGLTGTIGHLVIGPGGVFVVETRDNSGRVRIRGDLVVVGGHSHDVASHLRAQVAAVASTLGSVLDPTSAEVTPLICMRRAELPLMHRTVAGIPLLRESQLERRIARSATVLDSGSIARLGEMANRMMPPVIRRRALTPASEPAASDVPATDIQVADLGYPPGMMTSAPESMGHAPDSMTLAAGMALSPKGS
jgi:hypothetical protein